MKNKNILIITIVIAILLLVLMTSMLINGLNLNKSSDGIDVIVDTQIKDNKISKEDKEIVDKYPVYMENKYSEAITVEQKKSLTFMIDEVLEKLNERDYSGLYIKLSSAYAESQFSDEEDFKKFLDITLLDETDYICEFYDAKYHGYECAIASEVGDISFKLKIIPVNDFSDYELTFRTDIISGEERIQSFSVASINCEILYEIKCTDTLEFIVSMENTTNKSMQISLEDSNVESNFRGTLIPYALSSPTDEFIIKPKETKKVTLVFDIKGNEIVRPSHMNLKWKVNGKEYTSRVSIDFSDNEYSS